MKRVTIHDVALRAGVSSSTVSRVLNSQATISSETKQRVREACRALNYIPDAAARGLSGHITHTIGLVVSDISNPFFSGLCTAVEEAAARHGYRVLLNNTMHDEAEELEVIDSLLALQVDGMLIAAYSPASQLRHPALLGQTPCVYLGNNHGSDCSFVEADNDLGAYEATRYLEHLGHRDILFLGGRSGSKTLDLRLTGYRRAMSENGLTPRILAAPDGVAGLRQWSYQQARALFSGSRLPDAVIAYSDMIAMKVLEAARECGLRVPEDFSLLGFDNIAFGQLPRVRLTTVSQQKFEFGRLAVERLVEKINGDDRQTADILQPELMIRASCRRKP